MDSETSSNSSLCESNSEDEALNENFYENITRRIKSLYGSCNELVREIHKKERGRSLRSKAARIRRDRAVAVATSAERDLEQKQVNYHATDERILTLNQRLDVARDEFQSSLANYDTCLLKKRAADEDLRHSSIELHKYVVAERMARKYVGKQPTKLYNYYRHHFCRRGTVDNVKSNSTLPTTVRNEPGSSSKFEEKQSVNEDLDENLISRIQSVRKTYRGLTKEIKRKKVECWKRNNILHFRRNRAAVGVSSSKYDLDQKEANLNRIHELIETLEHEQTVARKEIRLSRINYRDCLDEC